MKNLLSIVLIPSFLFSLNKADVLELYKDDTYLKNRISIYQYMKDTQPIWQWTWQQLPIEHAQKVLDIGCGFGAFWQTHATNVPAGCHVVLADITPGALEICKQHTNCLAHSCSLEYDLVDIEQLPYADASFDRIHCFFVLYYTKNPLQALHEIQRVLKLTGTALIYVLHSNTNQELYEIAHNINPLFPAKDTILEQCCEKNIEQFLSDVFSSYKPHVYHRKICIPSNADMVPFVQSIAQGYKVEVNQAMLDVYHGDFHEIAQPSGLTLQSQSLLYVCRK